MKSDSRGTRASSRPRSRQQSRRVAHQPARRDAPASGGAHNFKATIEALALMTDSLPARVSDWLARGLQNIARAIALTLKQQWTQLTAPPERPLLPPAAPEERIDKPSQ